MRLVLSIILSLIALVIITDFVFPGKRINDEIISIKKERQQYYNAARNYHYTYEVVTNAHEFLVEDDFAKSAEGNENIEYSISRIFKEVNWYQLPSSQSKSSYSLRIMTGLAIPLMALISLLAAFRLKRNIKLLVFVVQVLLIADFIYLLY